MKYSEFIEGCENGDLKISSVNLVDVIHGVIKQDVIIHISKGLIKKIAIVDEKPKSSIIKGNNTIGLWAIPGLIDAHVHLFEIHKGEDKGTFKKDFEVAKNRAFENIREALKVGVTCVRDAGAFSAFNNRIRDIVDDNHKEFAFRIISCGRHITKRKGHWSDRGVLYDPPKSSLKEMVYNELEAGADFIKVMNDDPIFNLDELKMISSACKEVGRKFSCHACTKETIDLAFDGGADTIEHAACYSDEFCERVIKKCVAVCPTVIAAIDSIENIDEVLNLNKDCNQDDFKNWHNFLHEYLPKTFKAGVKVIAGTDAGTFPTNFQSLPYEIIQLRKLGATNLQALQSATINVAEALGITDITGSLEVNKSADLVFLGKNPLDNIEEAIVDVQMVISRGHIVINKLVFKLRYLIKIG